jgi:AraC-like DNA-binding protein
MSIEAINWALNHAPDFADEDPRKRPHLAIVLVGLANHADPQGRNAFPSIETLCRYTRLSESTVRRCLQRLLELSVIRPGDPELQAFYIRQKHADRPCTTS